MLTRRDVLALAPLPLLAPSGGSPAPSPAPSVPVPALAPGDPLARLAARYAALYGRLARLYDEHDALPDAAGADFEDRAIDPVRAMAADAERALMWAMLERGAPLVVSGETLCVSTCRGPENIPDPQTYVMTFPLAELAKASAEASPAPAPCDDPGWFFHAEDLVGSSDDEGGPADAHAPLRLEFEVRGPAAAAVRAWLAANTTALNEMA